MNKHNIDHPLIDNPINDDEIDLIDLFKTLWSHKKGIIITTAVCVLIAGIYSKVAPKEYKARTSFFMTSSDQPSSSLMGYAAMLGVGSPSNIESLIKNVLESESIKITVSQKFKPYYINKIQTAIKKNKLRNKDQHINSFIIGQLKLRKNFSFSVNKNNLFELTYHAKDPKLTKQILDTYLDQIIQYNYNLELSAEKNIITVIDSPQIPLGPFKPNLKLNIVLAFILGLFSSSIFVLIKHSIKKENRNTP
jgi:uncharacterized protein involved in exopolysaccharide biosynthesis